MPRKKKKIAVVDFETDPFEHGVIPKPFVGGFYDGDDYFDIWHPDCANMLVERLRDERYYVYAHNGGKFDWFFIYHHFDPRLKLINGRIAKATIGECTFLDSYLILPLPLAAHQKDEIDYNIMRADVRDIPENKAEIRRYLESDCKYLYDWVSKFIDRFGRRLTLAGAAFNQLEETGYPCKERTYESYDEVFRPYYFGGRTQAFKKGFFKGHYKTYDINSAYPRAMLDYHPFANDYYTIERPNDLPDCDVYFARINAISKGALPFRVYESENSKSYKNSYPDDDEIREYYVTGWEIRAGIETKTLEIIEILEVHIHDEVRHFKEYVNKFYKEKLEGKQNNDKDKTTFAKLMLNSAYGKFGQDGRDFEEYVLTDIGNLPLSDDEIAEAQAMRIGLDEYIELKAWELVNDLPFDKSLWKRPDPDDKFYNVATAASITGWVRAFLWESICKSEEPLYCDTDSIICKSFGGKISDELGDWDMEGETKRGVYVGGKKLYTMTLHKDKKLFKSAHKGARLRPAQIVDIIKNKRTIEWKNDAPSFSLKGIVEGEDCLKKYAKFVRRKIKMT